MKTARYILLLLLSAAMSFFALAQQSEDRRKTVPIEIHYRTDSWIMAPPVVEETTSNNFGSSRSIFLGVRSAFNPETGESYDNSEPALSFNVNDVRHFFRLQKKEFLLGEPILIEHRIELNGPGEWSWFVGGNYRARGRDDNFTFVLRKADGTFLPDVYPKLEGAVFGGGLGSDHLITKDKLHSYWAALQRYSAITEPGTYDLYCFTGRKEMVRGEVAATWAALPAEISRDHYIDDQGKLIDAETKQPSTRYRLAPTISYHNPKTPWPLLDAAPKDVLAFATGTSFREPFTGSLSYGIVGHFRITIREGAPIEQQEMIERLTKVLDDVKRHSTRLYLGSYDSALLESVWYSKQDYFLRLLEQWIIETTPNGRHDRLYLDGLAMRSDEAAFAVLLKAHPSKVANAFFRLASNRISDAIPLCIQWLTHPDNEVRAQAESHLRRWTGQSFDHTWRGYHYERPSISEGRSMQKSWRAWWEANKSAFVPCSSQCEKKE